MKYSEKLRDPRWQKKRLQILERDEWMCRMCYDSKSMLAVHHRYYRRGCEPWDYPDNALVTLCETCHEGESADLDAAKTALIEAVSHCDLYSAEIFNLALLFAENERKFAADDFDIVLFHLRKMFVAMNGTAEDWSPYRDAFQAALKRAKHGKG